MVKSRHIWGSLRKGRAWWGGVGGGGGGQFRLRHFVIVVCYRHACVLRVCYSHVLFHVCCILSICCLQVTSLVLQ